jgi:ribosomal protein S8
MYLTNHAISNLICKINNGSKRRLRFIIVNYNNKIIDLLDILYKNGVIRSYRIIDVNKIRIYLKYNMRSYRIKLSIISRPGNKIYWGLNKLSQFFNKNNFAGFYIISTIKGLRTSDYCLINKMIGGEILIKVEI